MATGQSQAKAIRKSVQIDNMGHPNMDFSYERFEIATKFNYITETDFTIPSE